MRPCRRSYLCLCLCLCLWRCLCIGMCTWPCPCMCALAWRLRCGKRPLAAAPHGSPDGTNGMGGECSDAEFPEQVRCPINTG